MTDLTIDNLLENIKKIQVVQSDEGSGKGFFFCHSTFR
jgi:hypothetical protein